MARHFLDVADAATLRTAPYLLAQKCVQDSAEARAIGVVHGGAGLGKTFAVEAASSAIDLTTTWFAFSRPSQTQLVKTIYKALAGIEPRGELWKLTDDLVDVLAETPRIIVVDEAQQLTAPVFEFLRFLHDHPGTDFSLIFVGGNGCWKVISRYPMLLSRVYREVGVRRLGEAEVVELIPRYHPIHRDTDVDLLMRIDEEFAHGTLRLWAAFTKTAADLCAAHGVQSYDARLAEAALTMLPNWQPEH